MYPCEVQPKTGIGVIAEIYDEALYQAASFVSKNGGTLEDARDLLHDAIELWIAQQSKGKEIKSDLQYLSGIVRHLWYARIRAGTGLRTALEQFVIDEPPSSVNENRLLDVILVSGKKCLDLLLSSVAQGQRMKDVAREFHFSNEHSAAVQKYKCLEKIRETIRTKALTYEDFLE